MVDIEQLLKHDLTRNDKIQNMKIKEVRAAVLETEQDIQELEQCQNVLDTELRIESDNNEYLGTTINQLKRSIHIVTKDRQKLVQQVAQSNKVKNNLKIVREQAGTSLQSSQH